MTVADPGARAVRSRCPSVHDGGDDAVITLEDHALVILFAVYAFIGAGLRAMQAFSSVTAGPVFGNLLLALIDLGAGVVAVAWPGVTALALVLIVGFWAFTGGFFEIFAAFSSGETAGTRALFILGGLVGNRSSSCQAWEKLHGIEIYPPSPCPRHVKQMVGGGCGARIAGIW